MTTTEIEERVWQFVLTSFLADTPPESFHNDDLFLMLDPLQILRLVVQLESTFGFKVKELTADNLSSVQRVAAFVARKLGNRGATRAPK